MKIRPIIKSLNAQIKDLEARKRWVHKHSKVLAQLPDGYFCGGTLDFDHLEHRDVIRVIRAMGGKWKKSKNENVYDGGKLVQGRVDYEQEIDGLKVRCYAGKAPPSCRIVEYEEVIPAHVIPAVPEKLVPEQRVKKTKMICTGDDPMLVSMAQTLVPLNGNKPNGES